MPKELVKETVESVPATRGFVYTLVFMSILAVGGTNYSAIISSQSKHEQAIDLLFRNHNRQPHTGAAVKEDVNRQHDQILHTVERLEGKFDEVQATLSKVLWDRFEHRSD